MPGRQSVSGINLRRDHERWRLAWRYARMSDSELENLASESAELTEVARRALQSELYTRGLSVALKQRSDEVPAAERPKSRKLAIVRRFRDMPEALLAKSVLESAGIDCLLDDANIVRTDWLWSNLVGGIKLRVDEDDFEEACRILDQDASGRELLHSVSGFRQRCPQCSSLQTALDGIGDPATGIHTGIPPRKTAAWSCQTCGHSWQELEPTA